MSAESSPSPFRIAALTLLREDREAQRLVAAWPNVPRGRFQKKRMVEQWAKTAGVRELVVEDKWEMLFRNGLCLDGGEVPAVVEGFLARLALNLGPPQRERGARR